MELPLSAPSSAAVFARGVVDHLEKDSVIVQLATQKTPLPLWRVLERSPDPTSTHYNGFEDMVNMETLNDAELLNNLIVRFMKDYIFTYVGPTLLVINPFKTIVGNFEVEVRNKYIN
jgi:myosin heavy subunit